MLNINDPIGNIIGLWSLELNLESIILRIFISIIISAIIGFERSSKRHAAGIRTFIIVCLSSTLAMIIDLMMMSKNENSYLLLSATSIIGVSIISVNTILYSSKSQIKGLTTSVSLWSTSLIGLLIGTGNYTIAVVISLLFISLLSIVPSLEFYLRNRSNHFVFHLELLDSAYLKDFSTLIRTLGLRIDGIENNTAYLNSNLSVYSVSVSILSKELKQFKSHKEIIEALNSIDYVYYIEEMK